MLYEFEKDCPTPSTLVNLQPFLLEGTVPFMLSLIGPLYVVDFVLYFLNYGINSVIGMVFVVLHIILI